jgi:hypothetical protein
MLKNKITNRQKFVLLHIMFGAILFGLYRLGVFSGLPNLGYLEYILISALALYGLGGIICALINKPETARHIANGVPMWALCFTVLGMVSAAGSITNLNNESLVLVFKNLAFAITPNAVGVVLMVWIRELTWWIYNEEV